QRLHLGLFKHRPEVDRVRAASGSSVVFAPTRYGGSKNCPSVAAVLSISDGVQKVGRPSSGFALVEVSAHVELHDKRAVEFQDIVGIGIFCAPAQFWWRQHGRANSLRYIDQRGVQSM